ncbi:MAG: hypothetical protein BMS9Abin06_0505 [Gammaproteobacteria bacterium]|nr:MAG: hypothetical protein BMS9Abin06_0505 [Gammaproteobacteria bacterium]
MEVDIQQIECAAETLDKRDNGNLFPILYSLAVLAWWCVLLSGPAWLRFGSGPVASESELWF